MGDIASVSKISSISILMVGCTGCLRTSPCYLYPFVCAHVLSRSCVSGSISEILCRISLGFQSFLYFFIDLWHSFLSGFLSRITFSSSLPFTFFFYLFLPLTWISPQFLKGCKIFILSPTSDSDIVLLGYHSLILILVLFSVLEVILSNLFKTPFGINFKVAFVWVLYLFKYLSSWFFFW